MSPRRGLPASAEEPLPRAVALSCLAVMLATMTAGIFTRTPRDAGLALLGIGVALPFAALIHRRTPRAAVALAAGAAVGVGLNAGDNGGSVGWFALCVLVFSVGMISGWRTTLATALAAAVLIGAWLQWRQGDLGWLPWIGGILATTLAAIAIRHERRLVSELRIAQAGVAERSRLEERARIARDLHDVIAHSLTVSLLHVGAARLAIRHDPNDAERALQQAERLGRESLDEVRSIVGLMRNGAGDPLNLQSGLEAIPELVARFRSAGVPVSLESGSLGAVPATVGTTAYRIAQEALTNAAKHAPGAAVEVRLTRAPGALELTVDSAGAPGGGTGSGLATMRERAEAVGGRFSAGPAATGWRVSARLPTEGGAGG